MWKTSTTILLIRTISRTQHGNQPPPPDNHPNSNAGTYIGSGATEKVLPVSRHILATMAGGAADCAFWIRHLAMQVSEARQSKAKGITIYIHTNWMIERRTAI